MRASDDTGAVIASYTYGKAGNKASETRANGITTTYSYDTLNRLKGLNNSNTTGTISFYNYTLYPNGKRQSMNDSSGTTLYHTTTTGG